MARRRRGNGKTVFACGHRGKGGWCHRCELADKLEEHAKSGTDYITNKLSDKPKKWTKKELTEEATRLRKEGVTFVRV